MSNLNEDAILKGIIEGDHVIIKAFYKENLIKVKALIKKNSGNNYDAEDVFQDAIVLTYQKLKAGTLKLDCSLSTYVYAVSRNIWMNKLRRRGKVLISDKLSENTEDLDASIIKEINKKEKQFLYQKHFLKLGSICQNLLLQFFAGKSMAKIAEFMNYSEGYARKKKFECKKQLLKMIESDPLYSELTEKSDKPKNS